MFVKEERIEYIFYLISGFCGANSNLPANNINHRFDYWFWKWLLGWIKTNIDSKYEPTTSFWYLDIKAIAGGEENEVPLFYDLCEKFFDDYRNRRGYFSDLPVDDEERGIFE